MEVAEDTAYPPTATAAEPIPNNAADPEDPSPENEETKSPTAPPAGLNFQKASVAFSPTSFRAPERPPVSFVVF